MFGKSIVSSKDYERLLGDLAAAREEIERLRTSEAFRDGEKSQLLRQVDGLTHVAIAENRRRSSVLGPLAMVAATLIGPTAAVVLDHHLSDSPPSAMQQVVQTCQNIAVTYSVGPGMSNKDFAKMLQDQLDMGPTPVDVIPDRETDDPADDFRRKVKRGRAITEDLIATIGNTPYQPDEVGNSGEVTSLDVEERLGESVKREIADRDQARLRDGEHPEATGQRGNPVTLEDILSKPEPRPYQPPRPPSDQVIDLPSIDASSEPNGIESISNTPPGESDEQAVIDMEHNAEAQEDVARDEYVSDLEAEYRAEVAATAEPRSIEVGLVGREPTPEEAEQIMDEVRRNNPGMDLTEP